MTNKGKENPINERIGIQKIMRQIVDAIHSSQSGISHNSPIKIDGEGAITSEVVWYYMASKNECCLCVK